METNKNKRKPKNKLHFQNVSRIVLFGGMKHTKSKLVLT